VVTTSPGCSTTGRAALPRLQSTLATSRTAVATTVTVLDGAARLTTSNLGHEGVDFVLRSTVDATLTAVAIAKAVVVAPRLADLAIGTVASHMSSLATDTADDAGREVLLLWAIVLAMSDFTAVLAGLVLIVSEGTVEGGKLAELVALEFVLAFRNGGSL
jgi:hypothetical protein